MSDRLAIEMFRHHAWATERLLEHCEELPVGVLDSTASGTYGTVMATLRHLSGADERYLAVLEDAPLRQELMEPAELDFAALRSTAADRAERWRRLLDGGLDPARKLVRRRPDGSRHTLTVGTIVVQAIHHGNDHRTHVCTILGALGQPVPDLDSWHFYGEALRPLVSPPPG